MTSVTRNKWVGISVLNIRMQWVSSIRQLKVLLVLVAVFLSLGSLVISHFLVRDLKTEESRNMETWAEALRSFDRADEDTDLTLVFKVLNGNNTIPVIVLGSDGSVHDYRNLTIHAQTTADSLSYIKRRAASMKEGGRCIRIEMSDADYMEICFADSLLLRRLSWWPYVQMSVVLIFVLVAIFALLTSKKAEQNKVWVGLSKETAHQLGTPVSSLMAWCEVLRDTYPDDEMLPEMGKDVVRLQRIVERFSKIGSQPELKPENLNEMVAGVTDYMERRVGNRVRIACQLPQQPLMVQVCAPLFEWVIENLCKNAVDAMEGVGHILIAGMEEKDCIVVEVSDTGKGILKKDFRMVFVPGFTTKKRGWGLGLSLAKRIVEDYHRGRIYVKNSELGKGTTFRIELKKR